MNPISYSSELSSCDYFNNVVDSNIPSRMENQSLNGNAKYPTVPEESDLHESEDNSSLKDEEKQRKKTERNKKINKDGYYKIPVDIKISPNFFGGKEWEKMIGYIGIIPPLPKNILQIWNGYCPFWGWPLLGLGKKVKDTHLLTYIPAFLNEKTLTILNFIKAIKEKNDDEKVVSNEYNWTILSKNIAPEKGGWYLISKYVAPGTLNKNFYAQRKIVNKYRNYSIPSSRIMLISAYTHFLKSKELIFNLEDPKKSRRTIGRCNDAVAKWGKKSNGAPKRGSTSRPLICAIESKYDLIIDVHDSYQDKRGACISRRLEDE